MKLKDLGFDNWFQKRVPVSQYPEYKLARIAAVNKNNFVIRNEKAEIPAELAGKMIHKAVSNLDLPTVGDWVKVQYFDKNTFAIIHEILPRKSLLKRKKAGNEAEYQLIASNIDVAFIMQSCNSDFNVPRLERYLIMVNEINIKPIILLSKTDLISTDTINKEILEIKNRSHDYEIIAFSNKTGQGLNEIENRIKPGKTYCLLGSSGVGKTTLLNNLVGKNLYATDSVRKKNGKGKHVTTRRQLIILKQGGLIIDTPGIRELANIGSNTGLNETFNRITSLAENCKFKDCTHINEPGCSVLKAVETGTLNKKHYQNFLKLKKELEYNEMTYLEKRRKDKKFGKICKQAMKYNKKK